MFLILDTEVLWSGFEVEDMESPANFRRYRKLIQNALYHKPRTLVEFVYFRATLHALDYLKK